jgi:LacI family transcriptional regulator
MANRSSHSTTQRPVTMKDIALQCGVSTFTVSRVLNKQPGINGQTAERVLAAATALGYDPAKNMIARRLVQRRYGTQAVNSAVGLIFPDRFFRVPYFVELFQGVMDILTQSGFSVLSTTHRGSATHLQAPLTLPEAYTRGEVDGVILLGHPRYFAPLVERLRGDEGFGPRPIISLIRPIAGCRAVTARDRQAGYLAARHLLTLGHRQIAHLQYGTPTYEIDEREVGFRQACAEWGLDPAAHLHPVRLTPGDSPEECTTHAIVQAVRAHPALTAVIALNDPTAMAAYYALTCAGVGVPDAISLVGVDNSELLPNERGENLLTTVDLSLATLGQIAARLILRQIQAQDEVPEEPPAPRVIVRATTAPPPAHGGY